MTLCTTYLAGLLVLVELDIILLQIAQKLLRTDVLLDIDLRRAIIVVEFCVDLFRHFRVVGILGEGKEDLKVTG